VAVLFGVLFPVFFVGSRIRFQTRAPWTTATKDRWTRTTTITDVTLTSRRNQRSFTSHRLRVRNRQVKLSAYQIYAMTFLCTYLSICPTIISPTWPSKYIIVFELNICTHSTSLWLCVGCVLPYGELVMTGRYGKMFVSIRLKNPWKIYI